MIGFHSFAQHIFPEHLLCARPGAQCWGHRGNGRGKEGPSLSELTQWDRREGGKI